MLEEEERKIEGREKNSSKSCRIIPAAPSVPRIEGGIPRTVHREFMLHGPCQVIAENRRYRFEGINASIRTINEDPWDFPFDVPRFVRPLFTASTVKRRYSLSRSLSSICSRGLLRANPSPLYITRPPSSSSSNKRSFPFFFPSRTFKRTRLRVHPRPFPFFFFFLVHPSDPKIEREREEGRIRRYNWRILETSRACKA